MGIAIMLHLQNKNVLVVGGGTIGLRKAITVAKEGAKVVCVSTEFCEAFDKETANYPMIFPKKKAFEPSDLCDMDLVIAATDNEALNQDIHELCQRQHIWCLTTDRNSGSDISFMATKRKENLTIAVSTDGKSPGFAKTYVEQLSETIQDADIEKLRMAIKKRKETFKT
jgi:precorrin-2 dehydrogenase/sirohydrochlorin ferrochelatase